MKVLASRTGVEPVSPPKEKGPVVIQWNLAAWIALYRTSWTHGNAYWTFNGRAYATLEGHLTSIRWQRNMSPIRGYLPHSVISTKPDLLTIQPSTQAIPKQTPAFRSFGIHHANLTTRVHDWSESVSGLEFESREAVEPALPT